MGRGCYAQSLGGDTSLVNIMNTANGSSFSFASVAVAALYSYLLYVRIMSHHIIFHFSCLPFTSYSAPLILLSCSFIICERGVIWHTMETVIIQTNKIKMNIQRSFVKHVVTFPPPHLPRLKQNNVSPSSVCDEKNYASVSFKADILLTVSFWNQLSSLEQPPFLLPTPSAHNFACFDNCVEASAERTPLQTV